ncbi:recombinase family protein [Lachnospiraceae bacterium ZAX-1]
MISTKLSTLHPKEEWIYVENTHEAIISKEEFRQVNDVVKKPK